MEGLNDTNAPGALFLLARRTMGEMKKTNCPSAQAGLGKLLRRHVQRLAALSDTGTAKTARRGDLIASGRSLASSR